VKWFDNIYSASADKTAVMWDTYDFSRIRTYRGHDSHVNSIDVSDNSVVTGSDDSTVKLWDTRQRNHTVSFNIGFQVTAVAHTGSSVFFGGVDNVIRSINLATNKLEHCLVGHADMVTSMASNKNGFLLSNAMDNTLMIWDVKPFCQNETRMVKCLQGATHNFEKNLIKCCWSEDETLVSAGSADRTVNVWDVKTGQIKHRLGGHKGSVNETCLRGKYIASASSDKTVIVGELME
jgi:Prp8 binding protein